MLTIQIISYMLMSLGNITNEIWGFYVALLGATL
jgi:hypothetical protein